jgi:hypothetical protein
MTIAHISHVNGMYEAQSVVCHVTLVVIIIVHLATYSGLSLYNLYNPGPGVFLHFFPKSDYMQVRDLLVGGG